MDIESIRAMLESEDEEARYYGLHRLCPCGAMGWVGFEALRPLIDKMRKDPNERVRKAALHVFQDAFEIESCGLQTTPQQITNEMIRTRRRNRWRSDSNTVDSGVGKRGQKVKKGSARK